VCSGQDRWLVRDEHHQLVAATASIRDRVEFDFVAAADAPAVDAAFGERFDIFHYAGHVDVGSTPASLVQLAHYDEQLGIQPYREGARKPSMWTRADRLAPLLRGAGARLAVVNACNSGHWSFMQPLMAQGIPAAVGVQGTVMNDSALAFAAALYRALAIGLSLDEAVSQGRLAVLAMSLLEKDKHPSRRKVFVSANDWLRFMVYMPSGDSTLFPRPETAANVRAQRKARQARAIEIDAVYDTIAKLAPAQRAEVLSRMSRTQVFILGRFDPAHKKTLDTLRDGLTAHASKYQPMVFDFDKPTNRNLTESVRSYALMSRFVVADISAPRCVPHELMAIVPHSPSIPVVPIIREGEEPYAMFRDLLAYPWVLPPMKYRDDGDLLARLDAAIVGPAEQRLAGPAA
jgi:CHAT domain